MFSINKVQLEIDERRNFLSEMEKHGQGAKFRPLIETEISQVRPRKESKEWIIFLMNLKETYQ